MDASFHGIARVERARRAVVAGYFGVITPFHGIAEIIRANVIIIAGNAVMLTSVYMIARIEGAQRIIIAIKGRGKASSTWVARIYSTNTIIKARGGNVLEDASAGHVARILCALVIVVARNWDIGTPVGGIARVGGAGIIIITSYRSKLAARGWIA